MKYIKYNTEKYNFKNKLKSLFNVKLLSQINDNIPVFKRENDQNTKYHKMFYKWIRTKEIIDLYDNFILEVVRPLYNEKIVYQAVPTFRICYPNNIAVGEFHKDKHYRNKEWAESVKEDNYFFPLTNAFDTNTIWVESKEDKGDYSPMNCDYGNIIQWDGSNLMHGNKINQTKKCRVSMDFRVIRKSTYIESDHLTINTKIKFGIGGYYKVTKS
tara:strand:+ start:33 stop:674 length:642 start_codon:yes stop_codon:yes gene_type:complete